MSLFPSTKWSTFFNVLYYRQLAGNILQKHNFHLCESLVINTASEPTTREPTQKRWLSNPTNQVKIQQQQSRSVVWIILNIILYLYFRQAIIPTMWKLMNHGYVELGLGNNSILFNFKWNTIIIWQHHTFYKSPS